MRLIKSVLITYNRTIQGFQVGYVDVELENLYKILECDIVECITRYIGNTPYSLIVDEMGAFHKTDLISAYSKDRQEHIVGSILIVSHEVNANGDLLGLNELDIKRIKNAFDFVGFKLTYDFKPN